MNNIDIIKTIRLNHNGHARVDCPFCGGAKTLSVTDKDGTLVWFCFRAGCSNKGMSEIGKTVDTIRRKLTKRFDDSSPTAWTVPDYFCRAETNETCIKYLMDNHCWDAYSNQDARIMYDPKQHRCVFLIRINGRVVDAVGRALRRGDRPKWLRYGASREPFICGRSDIAVIVEDAASACAVSQVASGFALLGTNLMDSHVKALKGFAKCLIALDKDATKKALDMHRRLTYILPCTVVPLTEDLKYAGPDKVKATLNL